MKFVKFVGVKCLAAWAVGIYQEKGQEQYISFIKNTGNELSFHQSIF